MVKTENKETRYYIDVDINTHKIVRWNYDQRSNIEQKLNAPLHRLFLTKGQYNKLTKLLKQQEK